MMRRSVFPSGTQTLRLLLRNAAQVPRDAAFLCVRWMHSFWEASRLSLWDAEFAPVRRSGDGLTQRLSIDGDADWTGVDSL